MRDFAAIRLDLDYTADAAVASTNIDYTTDGEMSRRDGMAFAQAQSGTVLSAFRSVTSGPMIVYGTSTGTIEVLSAT